MEAFTHEVSVSIGGSFILENKIMGGCFMIARQISDSEIWLKKPSSWKIIWIYILMQVNHQKNKDFDRGEGFFNFTKEHKQIGIDITLDMIKKFLKYARGCSMIRTTKSTRGIMIKVLNYNRFQTLDNYKSTTESTREAPEKHHYKQEGKNEKNTNIADTEKKPTTSRKPKNKYLEFVKLNKEEYIKLVELFGEEGTAERIENLNDYIGSKGDKYKSHYHTILVWERKNKPVEKEINEWG